MAARIRPSSAARLMQCAASLTMCENSPQDETEETLQGTVAHDVAFDMYVGGPYDERRQIESQADKASGIYQTINGTTYKSETAGNHRIQITDEMVQGAELYCAVIRERVKPGTEHNVHLETYLDCSSLHPDNGGTPDAWYWDLEEGILHIFDYKFGHRFVDAFENWQLINYAIAIMQHVGLQREAAYITFIEFVIVQPRSYHSLGPVRTWVIDRQQLAKYEQRLRLAYAACTAPNPQATTGEECRDCSARAYCQTLRAQGYDIIERSGSMVQNTLTQENAGVELLLLRTYIDRLQALESGVAAYVETCLLNNTRVPGWALEPTKGRERWIDSKKDEVLTMAELMGVSVAVQELVTPKQAIKAGLDADVVRMYSEVPQGKPKLSNDVEFTRRIFS